MEIEWLDDVDNDLKLVISNVYMGWVDDANSVHCMWMTYRDEEDDPRSNLIDSQYPEDHAFETVEQAKDALLESAIVAYIGGFRGR